MNKLDMASISFKQFTVWFQFQVQFSYRLQVDRVGFVCRMVSVDASVQERLRISEKY